MEGAPDHAPPDERSELRPITSAGAPDGSTAARRHTRRRPADTPPRAAITPASRHEQRRLFERRSEMLERRAVEALDEEVRKRVERPRQVPREQQRALVLHALAERTRAARA